MEEQFVKWLRAAAPYIHAFRGQTFVVAFPGELVKDGKLTVLAHDVSLLHALGIRVVLVHGLRPQVEEQLNLRHVKNRYYKGIRITDSEALECAKEAAGELRLDIEAAFSQGLPNTPMAHAEVRIISGNFVTATPLGIIDGINLEWTGRVRKIAADTIQSILDSDGIVLLSPLGYSPTGEAFNVLMEDVAVSAADALDAEKLIFLTETPVITDQKGNQVHDITPHQADILLSQGSVEENAGYYLKCAIKACLSGIPRAHLVPYSTDGAILLELFTHDGVGTMVTPQDVDLLREATIKDVGAILKLIEPYEEDGTLVKRSRELLEREIGHFSVLEHDGVIYGCAALYHFPAEKMAEMACLIVDPEMQGEGDGERILTHMENRARGLGVETLFILTTQTAHWFLQQGFAYASVDDLPEDKQRIYNWQRRSQVLVKKL